MVEKGPIGSNRPVVSVVINCFNGAKYLREAIDSVYAQTFREWEIVFWDNASSDESGSIARSYDKRLRYFRSQENHLLGKARNLAFAQARGEFIAILDCDDVWMPQKLEKQVALFIRNPELGMVFCDTVFFENGRDLVRLFQLAPPKRGHAFDDLLVRNFISSETMVFRGDVLAGLDHLFDERFTMVMDYDLSLRVSLGFPIDYVPEALSKWRRHHQSETGRSAFRVHQENRLLIEKLQRQYPPVMPSSISALASLKHQTDYCLSLRSWQVGRLAEARRSLRSQLRSPRAMITWMCSFLLTYRQFDRLSIKLRIAYWQVRARHF